ncbi:MAG: GNAT family N-acetyltransferase [Candidatus Pacebacteria bacterium]|nr:GNAT family N-acetyltransferase [Candidatus Paceibacterota bacterium]
MNTHHKNAQIGIVLGDKNFWGKGVASEVIEGVIQYACNTLDIEYIGAEVEEANIPMQKVLIKVGFSQDGLFKGARVKDGARIDVVHFGIGKGE